MNWTEGNLARHSRRGKNAALVARQKKYFAKSRSGFFQPSGTRAGPPSISFLPSPKSKGYKGEQVSYRKGATSSSSHHGSNSGNDITEIIFHSATSPIDESNEQCHDIARKRSHHGVNHRQADDLQYIQEKRRRLLKIGDWAGLSRGVQSGINYNPPASRKSPKTGWSRRASLPQAVQRLRDTARPIAGTRRHSPSTDGSQTESGNAYSIHIGSRRAQRLSIAEKNCHYGPARSCSPSIMSSQRSRSPLDALSSTARLTRILQDYSRIRSPIGHVPSNLPHLGQQSSSYPKLYRQKRRESSIEGPFPRITYSSSVIHVPIPRRKEEQRSAVLDWSPSQSAGVSSSIQVEIGGTRETIPPGQHADNINWRTWLYPSSCSQSPESQSLPPQISVSPCMSTLPSLMAHELPIFESLVDIQVDGQDSVMLPQDKSNSPLNDLPLNNVPKGSQSPQLTKDNMHRLQLPPDERAYDVLRKPENAAMSKQMKDDLDNLNWTKFLFKSDENSSVIINQALDEATYEAVTRVPLRNHSLVETPPMVLRDEPRKMSSVATCGTTMEDSSSIVPSGGDFGDLLGSPALESRAIYSNIPMSPEIMGHENQGDANASMVAEASTSEDDKSVSKPVFTMPSTFVGKLSTSGRGAGTTLQVPSLSRQPGKMGLKRGRRKQRALDGRPEIRNLPDFSSDPIEEF